MPLNKIKGVHVFLEKKKSRISVGILKKNGNKFDFEYDKNYLRRKDVIPLGPELPLTKRFFQSDVLFVPFSDRIPSRENPAYVDYCKATGIAVDETDPIILLTTIAHRGPSSFIFEPLYEDEFTGDDLLAFRKSLGLSVIEFAACFDFSPAAITRVERKQSSGREVLKRAEIYARYPKVALDQIRSRGGILHSSKIQRIQRLLLDRCKENI
jgi:HipA-like protein